VAGFSRPFRKRLLIHQHRHAHGVRCDDVQQAVAVQIADRDVHGAVGLALRELDAARRADLTGRHSHSYRVARIHAALGEADAAFAALGRAFEEQDENVVWVNVDPHVDPLREDPRFPAFLRRVGFMPE
jgi:hypothetical protein